MLLILVKPAYLSRSPQYCILQFYGGYPKCTNEMRFHTGVGLGNLIYVIKDIFHMQ
jgi:hypothetical protein